MDLIYNKTYICFFCGRQVSGYLIRGLKKKLYFNLFLNCLACETARKPPSVNLKSFPPQFRLLFHRSVTSRLHAVTNGVFRFVPVLDFLGASLEDFYNHVINNLQSGMSWDNYSRKGLSNYWVIDHVTPISYFNPYDISEMKMAFNYKNMVPKWNRENAKKSYLMPNGSSALKRREEVISSFLKTTV